MQGCCIKTICKDVASVEGRNITNEVRHGANGNTAKWENERVEL